MLPRVVAACGLLAAALSAAAATWRVEVHPFESRSAAIAPLEGSEAAGSLVRTADAYRALALLARHPRIDASRIALVGASGGARATLNAAMRRFARHFSPADGTAFAAFVALYAPCNARLIGDTEMRRAPLRLYSGERDIITCGPDDAARAAVHAEVIAFLRATFASPR